MTRQEWIEQAERHQRRMDQLAEQGCEPDDPIYRMHEARRDACYHNAPYAPDEEDAKEAEDETRT